MAVFFWITIWQFASMYLGQEILLASPVSVVRKLFELSFTGNFWQSVGFSFVRIVTGFLLAMFLGIFLAVLAYWSKTVEILIAPVIAVVKSTLILSCLAYAFGMLQGGLLICDWGGYEMWWDKKSILLIPLACCKMDFFYFVPVEPKPPSPLSVSSSSSTSLNDAVMYGAKTI